MVLHNAETQRFLFAMVQLQNRCGAGIQHWSNVCHYSETSLERPLLPCQTCFERIPGKSHTLQCKWIYHQKSPVLRDHIFMANGVVFQDNFYCTFGPKNIYHFQLSVIMVFGSLFLFREWSFKRRYTLYRVGEFDEHLHRWQNMASYEQSQFFLRHTLKTLQVDATPALGVQFQLPNSTIWPHSAVSKLKTISICCRHMWWAWFYSCVLTQG